MKDDMKPFRIFCSEVPIALYIEKEVDDVAVFHDVFLAFAADLALGLGIGHGA